MTTETRLPPRPRCVFDTNVVVSALLFPGSVPGRAFYAGLERGDVLASEATLAELTAVATRPKFERYVTADERERFVAALLARVEVVEVEADVRASRDADDDKFLALAVDGSAHVVVSGDADLLALHPFGAVAVLRPQAFLEALAA